MDTPTIRILQGYWMDDQGLLKPGTCLALLTSDGPHDEVDLPLTARLYDPTLSDDVVVTNGIWRFVTSPTQAARIGLTAPRSESA